MGRVIDMTRTTSATRAGKIFACVFACMIAMVLAWGVTGIAWANNDGTDNGYRVNDYASMLSSSDEERLSDAALGEVAKLQFDFVVYLTDRSGTAADLAKRFYSQNDCGYGADNDGIILCMKTDGTAAVYTEGLGAVLFSDLDTANLAADAVADKNNIGASEAVYNFLQKTITQVASYRGVDVSSRWPASTNAAAASNTAAGNTTNAGAANTSNTASTSGKTTADLAWWPKDTSAFQDFHNTTASRVVDNADLLTDEEEAELAAKIADMSSRLGKDFVLLTDVSSYGMSRAMFAADFYQFNGYGLGDDYSGVIYFVCMEKGNRGFWTAARGSARDLLTEANVNEMDDRTYDLFVDGEYAKAIKTQFDNLDGLYTDGKVPAKPFNFYAIPGVIVLAMIVGVVGGFIGLRGKKREMKTVETATNARLYSVGGLSLTTKTDEHYNKTVVRKPRVEEKSGGGGGGRSSYSGGYSSHGGGSFSGGGRSF